MSDRVVEALLLLAEARSRQSSEAGRDRLNRYAQGGREQEAAMQKASAIWDALDEAARLALRQKPAPPPQPYLMPRRLFLGSSVSALAASAAWLVFSPPYRLWPSVTDVLADYRTGPGERKVLTIDAGVTLDLNTRTTLNRKNPGSLALELLQGEVVISAMAVPVTMTAGPLQVAVQDGACLVNLDGEACTVTGIAGLTNVRGKEIALTIRERERTTVAPSLQAVNNTVDIETETAWQRGFLIFKDAPVAGIIKELNRYRPGRLFLASDDVAKRRLTAQIRIANINMFVANLPQILGVQQTKLPGGVIIFA